MQGTSKTLHRTRQCGHKNRPAPDACGNAPTQHTSTQGFSQAQAEALHDDVILEHGALEFLPGTGWPLRIAIHLPAHMHARMYEGSSVMQAIRKQP